MGQNKQTYRADGPQAHLNRLASGRLVIDSDEIDLALSSERERLQLTLMQGPDRAPDEGFTNLGQLRLLDEVRKIQAGLGENGRGSQNVGKALLQQSCGDGSFASSVLGSRPRS